MIEWINTKENKILMFNSCKCNKNLNLLFGANGVGKTSFLKYIDKCTNNKDLSNNIRLREGYKAFNLYSFSNSDNNYREVGRSSNFGIYPEAHSIVKKYAASSLSEGQSIIFSIQDFLEYLENNLPYENEVSNVILMDEIDSGLSVDNIKYVMDRVNNIINERKDIQMFISFNNYAVCENNPNNVLSMYTGKYIKINGYRQFRYYIGINRDKLLKKRKNNQFTGEILD